MSDNFYNNKSILITGGTGSFGKSFTKYLLKNKKIKKIIIYSRDEFKQNNMSLELNDNRLRFFLGDVRDKDRLLSATREVDFIIHAAALKQVPAAEYNPQECIKTNITGAENVIKSAIDNNVKTVVALSTDKAVNPINLYGATKLTSDKLFVAANNLTGKKKIKFSVVRYGNVMGSRGSVIELFKNLQNKKINSYPITDMNMTRFWITINEAVKFVDFCIKDTKGGEIYIPKLPSFKISDLVKIFNKKAKIQIIGIRPGEKLHESLISYQDSYNTLEFKKYYLIYPLIKFPKVELTFFKKNKDNEKGKKIIKQFEYSSDLKNHKIDEKKIQVILKSDIE